MHRVFAEVWNTHAHKYEHRVKSEEYEQLRPAEHMMMMSKALGR